MSFQRLSLGAVRLARLSLRSSSGLSCSLPATTVSPRPSSWYCLASHSVPSTRYLSSSKDGGSSGTGEDNRDKVIKAVEDKFLLDPPEEVKDNFGTFGLNYQTRKTEPSPLLSKEPNDDPFGLNFDDGDDGLGTTLPPKYKRDKITGAFTGKIDHELTAADRKLLSLSDRERDGKLVDRLDESGSPTELNDLGQRVRESDMGLNVLGRSVRAQVSKEELPDGSEMGRDDKGFSQHLTKQEFRNFAEFMRSKHGIVIAEDDVPVQENKSYSTRRQEAASEENPDHRGLALKWLSARAQRQLNDSLDDNPFADLMPGDLSHSRLVNRRHAKHIPRELVHHTNVELLKHFVAPTGLIRNRAQTRLGARDQRKVAKAIRRARNMGLVPYAGQYKVENHGWRHAPDMQQVKDWETEMVERGLVVKKKTTVEAEEDNDVSTADTSGETSNATMHDAFQ